MYRTNLRINPVNVIIDNNIWKEQDNFNTWQRLVVNVFNTIISMHECSNCSVNLLLTDNNTIRQLNKNFRNIDKPTNILSFPQFTSENREPLSQLKDVNIGDLAMSYDVIMKESTAFNKPFFDRCTHLFVHGVLHLLCMDHIEEDERIEMELLEIKILEIFGIKNPYFVD